ncbi:fungal protein [Schizosaccharomyces japonicus yFS275]|uniref:Fungal protein n=1 Tax=Schizosaccharomyces japonicus (strain yFS275 / FY16936) TaxID=402676 RepID=B6JXF8_SCHJY|nr:fungal protein [Schizosaccharomyces japonicus yFS275]EEB06059.1 fungal protein [Schizosaccharomyces japonicus yFS275]
MEEPNQNDEMLNMLDSLDQLGIDQPKADEGNESRENVAENEEDILNFLDELENEKDPAHSEHIETESDEKTAATTFNKPVEVTGDEKAVAKKKPEPTTNASDKHKEEEQPTEPTRTTKKSSNWFGDLWSTATEAVKSAERSVRSIKLDEHAHWENKWKDLADINKIGNELRSKALPSLSHTLQSVLSAVAPSIQEHEVLQVTVFHDIAGFTSLDRIIYDGFNAVLDQVEGGDLSVLLAKEGKVRPLTGRLYEDFALCHGLMEAKKLVKENLAEAIREVQKQIQKGNEDSSASVKEVVHTSRILFSLQACVLMNKEIDEKEQLCFVLYMFDVTHNLEFCTASQTIPLEWLEWANDPRYVEVFGENVILPKEWVTEWVEKTVSTSTGILAQMYTAKRMGLGEASLFDSLKVKQVKEQAQEHFVDTQIYTS